jgi:hypothetical protein
MWWIGKEKFLRLGTNSEGTCKSHEVCCVSANVQAILTEIRRGFSVCPGKWQDGAFSLPQSASFISFDSCIGFTGSYKLSEATLTVDCMTPLYTAALCWLYVVKHSWEQNSIYSWADSYIRWLKQTDTSGTNSYLNHHISSISGCLGLTIAVVMPWHQPLSVSAVIRAWYQEMSGFWYKWLLRCDVHSW